VGAWSSYVSITMQLLVLELEAQVTQSWMVFGTSPECPMVFAIGFQNGEIVN
jgi:hypothetical protein